MIISFDLDDTLIPGIKRFPVEPKNIWQRFISREYLRAGTIQLMKHLTEKGHKIFIYTTSYRSPAYIKRLFRSYGIHISKAINKHTHDKVLGEKGNRISKFPPAFNIALHIDDSPGVAMEGERHQFSTVIIAETDNEWTQTVLDFLTHR